MPTNARARLMFSTPILSLASIPLPSQTVILVANGRISVTLGGGDVDLGQARCFPAGNQAVAAVVDKTVMYSRSISWATLALGP